MNERRGADPSLNASFSDGEPDLVAALRRQWIVILVCALIGLAVGVLYTASQSTVYESKATLLLIAAGDEVNPGGGRERTLDVDTWATVARSTELLAVVADDLGLSLNDVRKRTTASAAATGDILYLTFDAPTVADAARGATEYSTRFLESRNASVNSQTVAKQSQLQQQRSELTDQIDGLSTDIAQEEAKGPASSTSLLQVLGATQQLAIEKLADVNADLTTIDTDVLTGRLLIDPETQISETGFSAPITALAGLFLGLLVGLLVALLRDRRLDQFATTASLEALGLQEIGRVPVDVGRLGSAELNDYNRIATRLSFAKRNRDDSSRSIVLLPVESTALPPSTASAVATRLRSRGYDSGMSVGVWSDRSLVDASGGDWDLKSDEIRRLSDLNDLVLVPAQPLDRSAIGLVLASLVDDSLLIVAERTPIRSVEQAVEDLRDVGVDVSQVLVVTGVRRRHLADADVRRPVTDADADADVDRGDDDIDDQDVVDLDDVSDDERESDVDHDHEDADANDARDNVT